MQPRAGVRISVLPGGQYTYVPQKQGTKWKALLTSPGCPHFLSILPSVHILVKLPHFLSAHSQTPFAAAQTSEPFDKCQRAPRPSALTGHLLLGDNLCPATDLFCAPSAMSHYGAKGQGFTEVTEVLVDLVSLVVAGKENSWGVGGWCLLNTYRYKHIPSVSHQNVTLHLYFRLHSKLDFHFLEKNHVFSQKKEMFVNGREKK